MKPRTPRGLRLHIGLFGRRNVGKSSLLNAITRQSVSIVSPAPGTTTDPVEKPMELLPFGPVLFIDTAGIDDVGALGEMRVERTRKIIDRTDLAVIVAAPPDSLNENPAESAELDSVWGNYEEALAAEFKGRGVPVVAVFNKTDLVTPPPNVVKRLNEIEVPLVETQADKRAGILDFKKLLLSSAPAAFIDAPTILGDIVMPGELCVLVVPIDKEAPRGRLILPQVQAIRDLLDCDAMAMAVKERELRAALEMLKKPPRLVVTDSQAFLKVAADVPPDVPMTSFSILFSRFKGDLPTQAAGAAAIDRLKSGDKVLVAEACSHHPIAEDIGRVKLPRWITQYTGAKLEFLTVQGHDFPDDISEFSLAVHCGACMLNRREMLSRIVRCKEEGVPVTNYGLAISFCLGIFERALGPFPAALEAYREAAAEFKAGSGAQK